MPCLVSLTGTDCDFQSLSRATWATTNVHSFSSRSDASHGNELQQDGATATGIDFENGCPIQSESYSGAVVNRAMGKSANSCPAESSETSPFFRALTDWPVNRLRNDVPLPNEN